MCLHILLLVHCEHNLELSKMARLRFPGRPGCRFDRFGVHYGSDERYHGTDVSTQVVSNIHRGLQVFRELFGESDEVFYKEIPFIYLIIIS